jgi:hypothetical protein
MTDAAGVAKAKAVEHDTNYDEWDEAAQHTASALADALLAKSKEMSDAV